MTLTKGAEMDTTVDFLTAESSLNKRRKHFHMMIKPIGPVCNLACTYCYYLEKENIYENKKSTPSRFKMSDRVLEAYIRDYIKSQPTENPRVVFAWQGGEATLLGLEFFERAVKFQQKYADGRRMENTIQTNGMFIDGKWAKFLKKHDFLVGISIDGPKDIHDRYRVNKGGKGTWDRVMESVRALRKHKVRFNTLTVVSSLTAEHPLRVYRFLKSTGSEWFQFLPIQERKALDKNEKLSLVANDYKGETEVTEESVRPEQWGKFLTTIFDEWVRKDVGKIFVKEFDTALEAWCGYMPSSCIHSKSCGDGLVMEHNGDVFSCDHYVYPKFKLGNIMDKPLLDMANSPEQKKFGNDKYDTLSEKCRKCKYLTACYGECPKHRFAKTEKGEDHTYLCPGYYAFYDHVAPYMHVMRTLLKVGKKPAEIMNLIKIQERKEKAEAKKTRKKERMAV
ncbi:anaerobic sulfatase-maturating enzyme [Fulvitalea axinellae]|uniref:Anaerobic sulfatase-maturating enzyme n=1 Tax=Fulvitalea axinellae TaxID=1182444 RepID=A0AAU9CAC2_9BACT|nr:anaerobic sulfatase-maturating enzyme [Fulvitalea axinellae]